VDQLVDYGLSGTSGEARLEAFRHKDNALIVRGMLASYQLRMLQSSNWCKERDFNAAVADANKASKICAGLLDEAQLGFPYLFERDLNFLFREEGKDPRRYNPWDSDFFPKRERLLKYFKVDYDSTEVIVTPVTRRARSTSASKSSRKFRRLVPWLTN
jgi:hypothetical protein